LVGQVEQVAGEVVSNIIDGGAVPVIAPIGLLYEGDQTGGQLLNVNADTVAGAIAAALAARWLVFMTDVPGVMGGGRVLDVLSSEESLRLIESGVIEGGMIPKVRACLQASETGTRSVIINGRGEHALLSLLDGAAAGTVVG
jgi:acetylglutamate kinase